MKPSQLGELIQIDHRSVSNNQVYEKHFQTWSPTGRFIHVNIYSHATSTVDGGSEFMKDFERACQVLKIKLYVLPPKRPQWNGGVERGNRTFRERIL